MSAAAAVEDWQVIDEELKLNENDKLGSGGYGTVFRGKYVLPKNRKNLFRLFGGGNKIEVAVKRIDKERVKLEDEILAKVSGNHRNVLHFYCAKEKYGWR